MYSEAYESYDSTNRILSVFTDNMMRRKAAEEVIKKKPYKILDIATGTGDSAILLSRLSVEKGIRMEIIGIDANYNMLKIAREKANKENISNIKFVMGDALNMKYEDNSFDAAICSFALKNFLDIDKFVMEVKRVIKKNGKFVVLDISNPQKSIGKVPFYIYIAYMSIFGMLTGKKLYKWLPGSTSAFNRKEFITILRKNRLRNIRIREFLFGISYIISCDK